jgi:beta-phosphoglucomutase-like phosphatase (HAD superfamily)
MLNTAPQSPATPTGQRTVKAILFDLDGTLLDTEALSDKAILQAFGESLPPPVREERRREGDRLPWEIKQQIVGLRAGDWIPMVIKYAQENWGVAKNGDSSSELPPPPSVGELWDAWEANLKALCPQVVACQGAYELVETASKLNIPLAIATSSRYNAVAKKRIRHEDMFQKMAEIVAGDDPAVSNGKPAPDIYLEAAHRLGVSPSECLVFEDAMSGVQSGKAAGCVVVAVPDQRMDKRIFEGVADVVLDNLSQFDGRPWGLKIEAKAEALPN